MRPAGEIRLVLEKHLQASGRGTTRQLAGAACVGLEAARRTLGNMVRDGVAIVAEQRREPGVKRPVPVYAPRQAAQAC